MKVHLVYVMNVEQHLEQHLEEHYVASEPQTEPTDLASESVRRLLYVDPSLSTVRLHGIARPFCPSVCLSVKRVLCDKMKETCAQILTPHERSFILVL